MDATVPRATATLERCRYPSKVCRNRRALKRNGELHRFCEEDRMSANKHQQRWLKNNQRWWWADVDAEVAKPLSRESTTQSVSPTPLCRQVATAVSPTTPSALDQYQDASMPQHLRGCYGTATASSYCTDAQPFVRGGDFSDCPDEELHEFLRLLSFSLDETTKVEYSLCTDECEMTAIQL